MDILVLFSLVLSTISIVISMFLFMYIQNLKSFSVRTEEKKPPKFLVPGRGFFTPQPKKRTPKYFSEEEQWQMEQDERLKRNKYSS